MSFKNHIKSVDEIFKVRFKTLMEVEKEFIQSQQTCQISYFTVCHVQIFITIA